MNTIFDIDLTDGRLQQSATLPAQNGNSRDDSAMLRRNTEARQSGK